MRLKIGRLVSGKLKNQQIPELEFEFETRGAITTGSICVVTR
jgi:hypothetical protein